MQSLPRPGMTVALAFSMLGEKTRQLLDTLDAVVAEAGGALLAAKDARMGLEIFARASSTIRFVKGWRIFVCARNFDEDSICLLEVWCS